MIESCLWNTAWIFFGTYHGLLWSPYNWLQYNPILYEVQKPHVILPGTCDRPVTVACIHGDSRNILNIFLAKGINFIHASGCSCCSSQGMLACDDQFRSRSSYSNCGDDDHPGKGVLTSWDLAPKIQAAKPWWITDILRSRHHTICGFACFRNYPKRGQICNLVLRYLDSWYPLSKPPLKPEPNWTKLTQGCSSDHLGFCFFPSTTNKQHVQTNQQLGISPNLNYLKSIRPIIFFEKNSTTFKRILNLMTIK